MLKHVEIENCPGYLVNEAGQVYSVKSERYLKPFPGPKGYIGVDLKGKWYSVHRLVAKAFISNPDNHPQVNHKDENKSNNQVGNLEWCSNQYNSEYSSAKTFKFLSPTGEVVVITNLASWCRERGSATPTSAI